MLLQLLEAACSNRSREGGVVQEKQQLLQTFVKMYPIFSRSLHQKSKFKEAWENHQNPNGISQNFSDFVKRDVTDDNICSISQRKLRKVAEIIRKFVAQLGF